MIEIRVCSGRRAATLDLRTTTIFTSRTGEVAREARTRPRHPIVYAMSAKLGPIPVVIVGDLEAESQSRLGVLTSNDRTKMGVYFRPMAITYSGLSWISHGHVLRFSKLSMKDPSFCGGH